MQATNPPSPQLLEQLRDIHGAAEPSWWPPAIGWWLLAALALVILGLLLRVLLRRLGAWRRRRAWLRALEAVDRRWDPVGQPHDYLADLNRLFRAVAVRAFPAEPCARLEGDAWVAFIRQHLPEAMATTELAVLAAGPYQPDPKFDVRTLQQQARAWVMRHG